jgi:Na+(H+)/acetate symporter ActP
MLGTIITIFLLVAFAAANLPWLTDRLFGVYALKSATKSALITLGEWLLLYFLMGFIALGIEKKFNSEIYSQGWEFYATTFCVFIVFALPGFIYRFDLKHLLNRAK